MAIENRKDNVVPLLVSVGCKQGCVVESPSSSSLYYGISPEEEVDIPCNDSNPVDDGLKRAKHVLSDQIENHMRSRLIGSTSIRPDEAYVYLLQQQELQMFKTDNGERCATPFDHDVTPPPMEFASQGGARIVSLDGGGMRGLIQLEILFEIEKMTGKRIVELFDWIIGNSIGGIMALGLVYADMTIPQLRRMYFRLKDKVFSSKKGFGGYNTKVLEELLQEVLGTEQRMCDRRHPKVLITAVDKSNTPMNIHYFNNCFDDQFSTQPVWKVARYSSAAPLYFSELDNYVDGGVMANNPCDGGLAKIQSFYQAKNQRMPISCMVSMGSGLFPPSRLEKISIFVGVQNLFRMLSDALGQSEAIADRCKTSCEAQGIPFYRFSPPLDEKIEPTETDSRKLVDIMILSRMYMHGMEDYKSDRLLPFLLQITGTA
ncbi:85/88 kDa calcium-independent phospholipase A2-like [Halichondria panicea]|uniref:85/88 kDa calcium-independent phospholipase A2-like n=1 Tax=Halichondria panicea TaxID=6063 RepID=UPI00312B81CF